jgi:hypothetical protein
MVLITNGIIKKILTIERAFGMLNISRKFKLGIDKKDFIFSLLIILNYPL